MDTPSSIGDIVRKAENEYVRQDTQISKYVFFSMHDTLEKIDAYLNSKYTQGDTDSLGREKPFFNISIAAANIWFRATDIDRKDIKIRGTKAKDWLDAFLATIHLQDWMRRERFGQFLNEWGRVLSRYGSAVVKFVQNSSGLHISIVPWNSLICDAVDFENNPKIEVLWLTEAQLRERITTHGYAADQVAALTNAFRDRETLDKQRKDNKSDYVKLYEVHGKFSNFELTGMEADIDSYSQQMHVISYVGTRTGRKTEYTDFTLYAGKEKVDPYMITHLIKEEGRTLAIGSIEHLFEAQWMTNHSIKAIKDTLDLSSKLIFQTTDASFLGRNVLTDMENGDILINNLNKSLTKLDNSKPDVTSWQNYAVEWKSLGNEITGVSEAMLGTAPKSGTAWRQTEALLQESYSLFELMTENKGLALEDMLRQWIIPYIKTQMDTTAEVSATLDEYDIDKIDSIYIKNEAIKRTNRATINALTKGNALSPQQQGAIYDAHASNIQDSLSNLGNQRFFSPSDLDDRTWKEQFKNLEWDIEIDITGEADDTQDALTTLNTALKLVVTPGFDQNPKAKAIVGRILEITGAMSPIEYNSLPNTPPPQPQMFPQQIPVPQSTAPPTQGA